MPCNVVLPARLAGVELAAPEETGRQPRKQVFHEVPCLRERAAPPLAGRAFSRRRAVAASRATGGQRSGTSASRVRPPPSLFVKKIDRSPCDPSIACRNEAS